MTLLEQIELDLTTALKSGDNFSRDTLRFLKSVIKNAQINSGDELTNEQIVTIIQREVKKRHDSEDIYNQANKSDLAINEAEEAALLKKYLPEQLDEESIKKIIIEYLGANPTEISQLGVAMGKLNATLKGRADMGLVSKILRTEILNG